MMSGFLDLDWEHIFLPSTPVLEIIIRGSAIYLFLFFLLRVILKRESGTVGISDLLVVVLLADASQNALADDYRSITDGLILVVTIVFWSYALNWLGYRFPRFQKLVHPPPLMLVKEGKLLRRNMRRELITEEELIGKVREQGIDDFSKIKEAFMEGDGSISVIPYEGNTQGARDRKVG